MKHHLNYFIFCFFLLSREHDFALGHGQLLRGVDGDISERELIIGGSAASAGDYPYFVHYASPGCGGALIAPDIVLTAAHCKLDRFADYGRIEVGRHNRISGDNAESFVVVNESKHPGFDDQVCCGRTDSGNWFYGVVYDFMLLKLSGESTKPIINLNTSPVRPARREELHVIGFGDIDPGVNYLEPQRLHEVTVNYLSTGECIEKSIYPPQLLNGASLCAADINEDACSGDSGGPLIAKGATDADDLLVGVVSWGWDCATEPGVYARVSQGYNWIRGEVCRLSENPPESFECRSNSRPTPFPTGQPTPGPTRMPTSRPTKMPTPKPTTKPTEKPTTRPTLSPTMAPVQSSTPEPTMNQTAEPTIDPTLPPTSRRTSDPTSEPTGGPTIGPTSEATSGLTEAPGLGIDLSDISPGLTREEVLQIISAPPVELTAIQRSLLPAGKSCAAASISPTVCCSSLSNNIGTIGEECLPAPRGETFEGGLPCESASWIQDNDPESYNPQVCETLGQEPHSGSNHDSNGSTGKGAGWNPRLLLPAGKSCDSLTNPGDCCLFVDNRSDQTSIYHGQPCVAMRSTRGFPEGRGLCEPANFVASIAPGRALDCADWVGEEGEALVIDNAFSPSMSGSLGSSINIAVPGSQLEELYNRIHDAVTLEEPQLSFDRTQLPEGLSCEAIADPLLCCAARHGNISHGNDIDKDDDFSGQSCVPVWNPTAVSSDPTCVAMGQAVNAASGTTEGGISSLEIGFIDVSRGSTSTAISAPDWHFETTVIPTRSSSRTRTPQTCRELTREGRRTKLSSGNGCTSLVSPRSCCSAQDEQGQPCVPLRRAFGVEVDGILSLDGINDNGLIEEEIGNTGNASSFSLPRCASIQWVLANAPQYATTCEDFRLSS